MFQGFCMPAVLPSVEPAKRGTESKMPRCYQRSALEKGKPQPAPYATRPMQGELLYCVPKSDRMMV